MALPSLADVIVIIVLLVPGFVSFVIFRRISVVERKFSDFETTIWSIFMSLVIYACFSITTGISDIDSLRDYLFQPFYLGIFLFSAVTFGLATGGIVKLAFRRELRLGDCWEIAMEKASRAGAWIILYTDKGLEYKGQLHYTGSGESKREMTIRKPKLILRDQDWKVRKEIEMGNEMFFAEKDIRRVAFFKDLDDRTIENKRDAPDFADLYKTLLTPIGLIITVSGIFMLNLATWFKKESPLVAYQLLIGLGVILLIASMFLFSYGSYDRSGHHLRANWLAFISMVLSAFVASSILIAPLISSLIPGEDRGLIAGGCALFYCLFGLVMAIHTGRRISL